MRDIIDNLTTGSICRVNLAIAVGMPAISSLTLEEKSRIFAALMTGIWFAVQITLALLDRRRKARGESGLR